MISLTNLRSLHEASAYDMEDDYLHGIALEDMGSIDESALLYDPGDMEILTEGAGSVVWDKIKKAFQAIVKFFKMLGAKIKSFVSGFFKKAEDEVKKAEKGESSGESDSEGEGDKPPMPKEEEQKLEDLEKKVDQKEEEVKTASAEKAEEIREEIAEHKEEIADIKRKYSRSKKYRRTFMNKDDAVVVELYHTGGWSHSVGVRHAAMDALIVAAGFGDREYTGSLKDIMSQDFAEEIDMAQELAEEQPKTSEKWQAYLSRKSQKCIENAKKLLSAKVNYDDSVILNKLMIRNINGKWRSGFLGYKKERFKKDQVISEIRKLIADAKKFMNGFTADCKEAEGTFNKIIQDLNGYQKDESKAAYAEVFKIQAQCCNKAIGVINKMSSMHAASIREAIQYDINVLHEFQ